MITERFVSAAELTSRVLGAEGYEFVTIPHPISSRSVEELGLAAAEAADLCARLLMQADSDRET